LHDEPLWVSLTKNLGCPYAHACGIASELEVKAMSAGILALDYDPFAF